MKMYMYDQHNGVDTHAHLNTDDFKDDLEAVLGIRPWDDEPKVEHEKEIASDASTENLPEAPKTEDNSETHPEGGINE
jgi:hypothetical protein